MEITGPPLPSTAAMREGMRLFLAENTARLQQDVLAVMCAAAAGNSTPTGDLVKLEVVPSEKLLRIEIEDKSFDMFSPRPGYELQWARSRLALAADAKAKGWKLTLREHHAYGKPTPFGMRFEAAWPRVDTDVDVDDGLLPSVHAIAAVYPKPMPEPVVARPAPEDPEIARRTLYCAFEREVRLIMAAYAVDGAYQSKLVKTHTDHSRGWLHFIIDTGETGYGYQELPWAAMCAALQNEAHAGGWELTHTSRSLVFECVDD